MEGDTAPFFSAILITGVIAFLVMAALLSQWPFGTLVVAGGLMALAGLAALIAAIASLELVTLGLAGVALFVSGSVWMGLAGVVSKLDQMRRPRLPPDRYDAR